MSLPNHLIERIGAQGLSKRRNRGGFEQVSNQTSGDGLAAAVLLVLSRGSVERHDHGDALGGCPLERVDHDQLLHDPLVDRRGVALQHERVAAAHRLLEAHEDLAVGEVASGLRRDRDVKLLGDLLGLMVQYISTAGMFPVLTANAYNIWATASDMPLATQITSGVVYWTTDDYPVFGIPSGVIGGALFLAVAATIFWILIRRRDAQSVLTGFALLLVAFFALPTRVHERYLVQAFAVLALVWAAKAWHRAALGVLAVANTVNLHAILAQDLRVETVPYVSAPAASTEGLFTSARTPVIGAYMPEDYGLSWVRMDAQWAREPWVVYLVVLIHTASFGVLLLQFIKRKNRTPITTPISNRKEEQ